jgi:hypothetical protein
MMKRTEPSDTKKPSERPKIGHPTSALPLCVNSGIRDNHTRGAVADFLREKIKSGSHLSIVSAYFTIYAYDALKENLDRIGHLDFLFGEPTFVNRLDPSKTEKKAFIIDASGLELANRLQQKRVAKECAEWIERKVDIKTIKQSNLLHGKMYHIANQGVEDAILGSSNFTVHGLGLGNGGNNIEHTFQRRAAANLLSSRSATLPSASETPTRDGADFDLVTWMVILSPEGNG